MKVLVGSTVPAYCLTSDHWGHWVENASEITQRSADAGIEVDWLCVLQHDARGREPFGALSERLSELQDAGLNVTTVWFSFDPGEETWTVGNRLQAICTARNLIVDHALDHDHDWIYFADADVSAPRDVLVRLLELDWPVVAAHVPAYRLNGRRTERPGDVREHWSTAGSLLIAREAFRRVPWRYDPDAGNSDDPATQAELARLGWRTLVRHDVTCEHHPPHVRAFEDRGHDLAVHR